MEYKYVGIILKKRNVGETDRICTIYTLENGKVRSMAKGVRKPHAKLAASLENIILADITIEKTKGLGKITGSIIENNFTDLKKDCQATLEVFAALNLFDRLVDFESPDHKVFNLLKDYLLAADSCAAKSNNDKQFLLRLGFIVKLLHELGYTLEVKSCVKCGNPISENAPAFSAQHGGALCPYCFEKNQEAAILVHVNAIKMIRLFLHNRMSALSKIQASKEDCDRVNLLVEEFLRWNS